MSIPRKTVKDKATMKEVVLTDEELDIINRIQNAKFPGTDYDPYEVSSVKLQFFPSKLWNQSFKVIVIIYH